MSKIFKSYYLVLILSIFIIIFIVPFNIAQNKEKEYILGEGQYLWPLPGYSQISSYFGKRNAPTKGASSFHYGIDIPAPQGTKFIAICDGQIIYTGFLGAGGYTITLEFEGYRVTYCHCDPNFIVKKGDIVSKGEVIGYVGPKYVDVPGNIYYDGTGKGTNGATTGPHLHFGIRKEGSYINPLNVVSS